MPNRLIGWLLGKAPLGMGQGGGVTHQADFAAPPYYFVNDTFTTNRASGAINGTVCEPGPGKRFVAADAGGYQSISSGDVVVTNASAAGDPGLWLLPQVLRQVGRVVIGTVTPTAASAHFGVGWDVNLLGNVQNRLAFGGSGALVAVDAAGRTVGAYANGTTYQVAVITRAAGQLYFVKGGAFTNWTLLWVSYDDIVAGVYASVTPNQSGASYRCSALLAPRERWMPTPLISDGFSGGSSSDGLGHQEGAAAAIYGQGGDGVAWTDAVGTWEPTGGALIATVLAGRAIRVADAGEADVIITANATLAGNTMSIIVRWTDENNFVQLRLTSTNLQLVKAVASVSTTVLNTAVTYVAGAPIRLICQGSAFRCFYNNAAVGAEQTISDAAVASATVVGVRTDNAGNTFDNFIVYARGSGGEYNAALDALAGL